MTQDLPSDTAIELAVIGGIIQNTDKYNDISKYIVSDDVWHESKCKMLWQIISGMIKRREHIDMITITATLTEENKIFCVDAVFIVDCTNNAATSNSLEKFSNFIQSSLLNRTLISPISLVDFNLLQYIYNSCHIGDDNGSSCDSILVSG